MDILYLVGYALVSLMTLGLGWVVVVLFRGGEVSKDEVIVSNGNTQTSQADKGGKKGKGTKSSAVDKVGKNKNKQPRSRTTSEAESTSSSSDSHPWSAAIFRGHAGVITDMNFSSNSKFIASCAEDRTVLIWFAKDLLTKDRRSIRVNVPFDNAKLISWSPDCTAFIVSREEEKVLEVFKMGKKAEGSHVTVNSLTKFKKEHEEDIVGVGIACTGLYIMSCSKDGNLIFWDVKGTILERVNAPVGTTATCAKVSTCGRYVAVCGNDCLIMTVSFNDMKEFQSVRIFGKLKGHESRVENVDFNADSTRIVTVTENGFWRLFDTTGNRINVVCMGQAKSVPITGRGFFPTVALSTDGRLVAVGHTNQVDIFEITLGSSISNIQPSWSIPNDSVMKIVFSPEGKYILVAGEKCIRVFHNICGYIATVRDLAKQIAEASSNSSLKTRLTNEINKIFEELSKLKLGDAFEKEVKETRKDYLSKTGLNK